MRYPNKHYESQLNRRASVLIGAPSYLYKVIENESGFKKYIFRSKEGNGRYIYAESIKNPIHNYWIGRKDIHEN